MIQSACRRLMNSIALHRSSVVYKFVVRMSSTNRSYEDAICKLNLLQSNKSSLEQIKRNIKNGFNKCTNIEDMEYYLKRTGVPLSKLDELSVIHVAGTKGKGSTSAMCECVLRSHGLRTGFYSSPHLVAVRERIRVDGVPLTEEQFSKHFHTVYDKLYNTQEFEGDMPKYFAFLTVMAYNVFLEMRVDVAVVEVGIGGIVDYTNVLRKVPVVGITALGLDHTSILGHTLPEIAAAKAGVMKAGCEAYTVHQPNDAMDVLTRVAQELRCPLTLVPDYNQYTFPNTQKPHLQVELDAYRTNASLAIQLAHAWMRIQEKNKVKNNIVYQNGERERQALIYDIPLKTMEGLRNCKWPGRYHVVRAEYATFYLDGAHTKESMDICAQWFKNSSSRLQENILIFSATGDRNSETLLKPLSNMKFHHAYFVIPTAYRVTSQNNDNFSLVEQEDLVQRCFNHSNTWRCINSSNITVFECVSDALIDIKNNHNKSSVLITGSLHLVGAALSILDPSLST